MDSMPAYLVSPRDLEKEVYRLDLFPDPLAVAVYVPTSWRMDFSLGSRDSYC